MRRRRRTAPAAPKAAEKPPKTLSTVTETPTKKSTHKSTWKAFERRIAKDFGTKRTALSGGNSGVTRADTMHADLFIEAKLRASFSLHTLFVETEKLAAKENKTAVVAIKEKAKKGYLLLLRPEDLQKVARLYEGDK